MSPAVRPAIDRPVVQTGRRKKKIWKSLSAKTSSHRTMPCRSRVKPIPVRSSSN